MDLFFWVVCIRIKSDFQAGSIRIHNAEHDAHHLVTDGKDRTKTDPYRWVCSCSYDFIMPNLAAGCQSADISTVAGETVSQLDRAAIIRFVSPITAKSARSLHRRKYSYCEIVTTVHFSALYRQIEVLFSSKQRKTDLAVPLSRYGYFHGAGSWYR